MEKEQDIQDRKNAAKTLIEFVANYSILLEDLLESVRGDMAVTVDQVMEQLNKVNAASNLQRTKANQIIKGQGTDQVEGEVKKANEAAVEGILTKPTVQAKEDFVKKMDSLDHLDKRIQKLMMTMMGALSADDVVGQRIKHTKLSIALLGQGLAKVVDHIDNKFTRTEVANLNQQISRDLYKAFSMEEERANFRKIFGKEPD